MENKDPVNELMRNKREIKKQIDLKRKNERKKRKKKQKPLTEIGLKSGYEHATLVDTDQFHIYMST